MAYSSTILNVTMPTSWTVTAPRPDRHAGFWASRHYLWEIAGYTLAGLIVLAAVPTLFVTIDHAIIVQ